MFCEKRCSSKFRKFHRKTPVLEPVLIKLQVFKNRKTPVLEPLLIKLQVFKNTYIEEHLWTTASEKINICLIFK